VLSVLVPEEASGSVIIRELPAQKSWCETLSRAALFPEMGVLAPPSPYFKNVQCEREAW